MSRRPIDNSHPAQALPAYRELERLSDDEVMAGLQAGAHDALAVLFDRYHTLVFSIAHRIVRDTGEAEDVTQIVFLDLFRAAAQFDASKGTTKVWLLQYAYHRALSRKRHLNVRNFYDLEPDDRVTDVPPTSERAPFGLSSVELRNLLEKGLASLTPAQRNVIERASFDGLSMKEIAEQTGETLVNVRHHYYRGLRRLRTFVESRSIVDRVAADA
jgi:RNA polymerase sigma-70 factor (ECF subfamily)